MSFPATAPEPACDAIQAAAIRLSKLLRDAKVDAPLRPRVLAALVLAAAVPDRGANCLSLAEIDRRVADALLHTGLAPESQRQLAGVLALQGTGFAGLESCLPAINQVLDSVNAAGALHAGYDFLGIFYEAFLRYGYDNNALGIVFTPRHITRFCVELAGVTPHDRIIDLACGTGGFLVPAAERLQAQAAGGLFSGHVCGYDTNPTVWALAVLNLLFRAEPTRGRNGRPPEIPCPVQLRSCFEALGAGEIQGRFTRAFLNPPFSQGAEPERDFLDASMEALTPGGICAAVVKAGIFADEEHAPWRAKFLCRHRLLAVVSLPEDLFYPTAAPSSLVVATAHTPQTAAQPVLMARVFNDGFEKLKNKRVPRAGSDLPEVKRCFTALQTGTDFTSPLAIALPAGRLAHGAEWSPQAWLPHPRSDSRQLGGEQDRVVAAVFRAVADFPELAEVACDNFASGADLLPCLPWGQEAAIEDFFEVLNGRSAGEKHYPDGAVPYVSSGGSSNSILRLVEPEPDELFAEGGVTVTAFGHAALQPWPFLARGNGGSAVRVLRPRYRMGLGELAWFVAQINAQEWRFFYARMAIKSRVERLMVSAPPMAIRHEGLNLAERIRSFRETLVRLSRLG